MNTESTPATAATSPVPRFRPQLTIYHPNMKGTGCAVQMELHPAHDNVDGSIMLRAANQSSIGNPRGETKTYHRFDWKSAVSVKLDFNDLCKFMQVFRGECETLEDGKGLYHQTARASTRIVLRHLVEPMAGYSFELYRVPRSGDNEQRTHFFFYPHEALGLCEAIAGSMSVISFGIPVVIPHDTSAYETENREFRNARAA